MSEVAAYNVGFSPSWPLTHPHTDTSAVDVTHAAVQMHITTSPPQAHARSGFQELPAALITMSQNTDVKNNTHKKQATFCASKFDYSQAIIQNSFSFPEYDQLLVRIIGTFWRSSQSLLNHNKLI